MAIKMRTIKNQDIKCKVCGKSRKESLEIFEIMFNENIKITICDACNEQLFNKTLKASCLVNSRLKDKKDLKILQNRRKGLELESE